MAEAIYKNSGYTCKKCGRTFMKVKAYAGHLGWCEKGRVISVAQSQAQSERTKGNTYHKGHYHSEETKQHWRETRKGSVPWNKDKKNCFSEGTLKQMSESHIGKPSSMKGKKHKPESVL